MKNDSNLAILPNFKDGDDGGEGSPLQVSIDSTMNGFVLAITGLEEDILKCYLFHGKNEDGPQAMIQTIIDNLGIADKVKLQK